MQFKYNRSTHTVKHRQIATSLDTPHWHKQVHTLATIVISSGPDAAGFLKPGSNIIERCWSRRNDNHDDDDGNGSDDCVVVVYVVCVSWLCVACVKRPLYTTYFSIVILKHTQNSVKVQLWFWIQCEVKRGPSIGALGTAFVGSDSLAMLRWSLSRACLSMGALGGNGKGR